MVMASIISSLEWKMDGIAEGIPDDVARLPKASSCKIWFTYALLRRVDEGLVDEISTDFETKVFTEGGSTET